MIKDKETYFELKRKVIDEFIQVMSDELEKRNDIEDEVRYFDLDNYRIDELFDCAKNNKRQYAVMQREMRDTKNKIDSILESLKELKQYEQDFEREE